MSIDGGVRNTTMLVLLMCIPLLIASFQHTFGLGDQITASRPIEDPPAEVSANNSDSPHKVEIAESSGDEPELLVFVETEAVSRDDSAIVERETEDLPTAHLVAAFGTESAEIDQESPGAETTVQTEEEPQLGDATAEFEQWSVTLDDNIRESVLREITAQLEKATANLDREQARLERLQVATELYRMQVQHLQNRRQEWEPVE